MLYRFDWRDCRLILGVVGTEPSVMAQRVSTLLALPVVDFTKDGEVDLTVRELTDGAWLLEAGHIHQLYTNQDDLLVNLLAQMGQCFIQRTGLLLLHAAACSHDGKAVMFAGPSRVGKTSLALTAWLAGHEFLGDDCLAVDPHTLLAMTFPKALKLRVTERAIPVHLAPILPTEQHLVGRLCGEYRLLIGRGMPRMVAHERVHTLGKLYLVERASSGPSRVEPLTRDDALRGLLAQVLTTRPSAPIEGVNLLRNLRSEGAVFRLLLGENDLERAVELTM